MVELGATTAEIGKVIGGLFSIHYWWAESFASTSVITMLLACTYGVAQVYGYHQGISGQIDNGKWIVVFRQGPTRVAVIELAVAQVGGYHQG